MKETWLYAREWWVHVKFTIYKILSADGRELNTIISSAMEKALKIKKRSKGEAKYDYDSDVNFNNFIFKYIDIVAKYYLK